MATIQDLQLDMLRAELDQLNADELEIRLRKMNKLEEILNLRRQMTYADRMMISRNSLIAQNKPPIFS